MAAVSHAEAQRRREYDAKVCFNQVYDKSKSLNEWRNVPNLRE
jgi:hypothetical protein